MPHNRAVFRELVDAAFSNESLRIFCSDNFSEVYNNFTSEQSKSDRVLALIDYVERHNGFDRLASLVRQENPEQYEVFATRLSEEAGQSVPPNPAITKALVLTQEALKEERTYLQRRFEAVLGQIDLLSDYKALHDGLHEIQYSYYQNIIDNTRIVLDDKYAKYNLFNFLKAYRRDVSSMQDTTRKGRVEPVEEQWIDQLDKAANDL